MTRYMYRLRTYISTYFSRLIDLLVGRGEGRGKDWLSCFGFGLVSFLGLGVSFLGSLASNFLSSALARS